MLLQHATNGNEAANQAESGKMRLMIEYLDGEQKGQVEDISSNLYFFEENFYQEIDERGISTNYYNKHIRVYIEEKTEGL